ncbi:hypothetical protein Tco_0183790 [Tanacetum coccineum]
MSSSFHSKLQISPPSSHEPTSPYNLNPLLDNISDVHPRPLNPQPLQSHPSFDITLSLSPITPFDHIYDTLSPPSLPQPQPPIMGHPLFYNYHDYHSVLAVDPRLLGWIIGQIPNSSHLMSSELSEISLLLVAYKLELPEELSNVCSAFYVSNLKKCLFDESLFIPMRELRLNDKLNFMEEPVEIMDREVKQLKQSCIPIVKVRWTSKRGPEFTWEREDQIHAKYPHMFSNITPASN